MSEARPLRLPARNSQLEVRGGGGEGPWWFHRGAGWGEGKRREGQQKVSMFQEQKLDITI